MSALPCNQGELKGGRNYFSLPAVVEGPHSQLGIGPVTPDMLHRDKLVLEILKPVILRIVLPKVCQIGLVVVRVGPHHVDCLLVHRDHPHVTIFWVHEAI